MACENEYESYLWAIGGQVVGLIGFGGSLLTGAGIPLGAAGAAYSSANYIAAERTYNECIRNHNEQQQQQQNEQNSNNNGSDGQNSGSSSGGGYGGSSGGGSSTGGTTSFGGTSGGSGPDPIVTVEEVQHGTPVVLDLDGDGVELVAVQDSRVTFDFDGDGTRDATGWAAPDDGILAYDVDGNGRIENAEEIAFTSYLEGAQTDLEGLKAFDTNEDGLFGVGDAEYDSFYVWQDLNQNGVSDDGELVSLADAGIESIDLTLNESGENVDGNIIHNTSTFTRTDGSTGEVGDIAFAFGGEQLGTIHIGIHDGEDEFAGNQGTDIFVFIENHGTDTVTNFDVSEDILILNETSNNFTSVDDVLAAATQTDAGVVINTGGGEVVLAGLNISNLQDVQYIF